MTFQLHIDLGNDAMKDSEQVAAELRKVARAMELVEGLEPGWAPILDGNGNMVGRFEVVA